MSDQTIEKVKEVVREAAVKPNDGILRWGIVAILLNESSFVTQLLL